MTGIKSFPKKQIFKSTLLIIATLFVGILIVIIAQSIDLPDWINRPLLILLAFLVVNFLLSRILKTENELREYWSLKKTIFLIPGIFAGAIIAVFPYVAAFLLGFLNSDEVNINTEITLVSLVSTFIIVAWEELWFRGIFLNYCSKYISVIKLSLIMGFLFMLIHFMNPKIDLIKSGPALFFAGATLTLLYFYYRNIWLPIGLHFGNNYMVSIFNSAVDDHFIFGNEGLFSSLLMGSLFLIFALKIKGKHKIIDNKDTIDY